MKKKKVCSTNLEYLNSNKWFQTVCKDFCIKPTVRQVSKWRRKKGLAYKLANCLE